MAAMLSSESARLDFAYKYPFSKEAKDLIKEQKESKVEDKFLTAGLLRVNEALERSRIEFVRTSYRELQYTYLISYVYARMLASAPASRLVIAKYVTAEAERSRRALAEDTEDNMLRVANGVGIATGWSNEMFEIGFNQFLAASRGIEGLRLVDMQLGKGVVRVGRDKLMLLIRKAMETEIMKGLPIDRKFLPKEVLSYAKELKVQESRVEISVPKGTYAWIEKLLLTPIPDIRHRSVNLVLAPYLVNVVKMDESAAADKIIEYIERCKLLDPNTKVNEPYIRYQCKYAKSKGMRPLSLARARELFKGVVDFG